MKKSKAEAERRIQNALQLIEHAQGILAKASESLSRVRHSESHWDLVAKGYDDVHNLWRAVNVKTAGHEFRMDSDWERANPENPED